MRNAKDSALNRYAVKNGKNRDGNEGIRKGLGCTNRSIRMDRYSCFGPKAGNRHTAPGAQKIARQEPAFPFHEDGNEALAVACDVWEFRRFFDARDGSLAEARAFMAGTIDADEWEADRYADEAQMCGHGGYYSVQMDAYGDWSTAIGRISYSDAIREADAMREFAWYGVRVVADRSGAVVA